MMPSGKGIEMFSVDKTPAVPRRAHASGSKFTRNTEVRVGPLKSTSLSVSVTRAVSILTIYKFFYGSLAQLDIPSTHFNISI